jgi:hypothetical protein
MLAGPIYGSGSMGWLPATAPVRVTLPAPEMTEPVSTRKPRSTCPPVDAPPALPVMLMAPVPPVMLELVTTTPAAEPPVALAPPPVRLPLRLIVPVPVVLTVERVPPLSTISSECVSLVPAALSTTLPPAALTLLPSTWMLPLAAVRLVLPNPVFWMPLPCPRSVTTILPCRHVRQRNIAAASIDGAQARRIDRRRAAAAIAYAVDRRHFQVTRIQRGAPWT